MSDNERKTTPAHPAELRDVLHDAWLRIHCRRFDGSDHPDARPDYVSPRRAVNSFYAGILAAEAVLAEVAAEHGIDWRSLRAPSAQTPADGGA